MSGPGVQTPQGRTQQSARQRDLPRLLAFRQSKPLGDRRDRIALVVRQDEDLTIRRWLTRGQPADRVDHGADMRQTSTILPTVDQRQYPGSNAPSQQGQIAAAA